MAIAQKEEKLCIVCANWFLKGHGKGKSGNEYCSEVCKLGTIAE